MITACQRLVGTQTKRQLFFEKVDEHLERVRFASNIWIIIVNNSNTFTCSFFMSWRHPTWIRHDWVKAILSGVRWSTVECRGTVEYLTRNWAIWIENIYWPPAVWWPICQRVYPGGYMNIDWLDVGVYWFAPPGLIVAKSITSEQFPGISGRGCVALWKAAITTVLGNHYCAGQRNDSCSLMRQTAGRYPWCN